MVRGKDWEASFQMPIRTCAPGSRPEKYSRSRYRCARFMAAKAALAIWLRLEALARQILCAVQDANDLYAVSHGPIEENVASDREAAQLLQELGTRSTQAWILRERRALFANLVEHGVRSFRVIECDIEPDLLEIVFSKDRLPHSRQWRGFSAICVARAECGRVA